MTRNHKIALIYAQALMSGVVVATDFAAFDTECKNELVAGNKCIPATESAVL